MDNKTSDESRLDRIERTVSRWSKRLSDIDASRKHYLRTRMKTRVRMMTETRRLLKKLSGLDKVLGTVGVQRMAMKNGQRVKMHVLMLTRAEYVKLKAILNEDLRLARAFRCTPDETQALKRLVEKELAR